MAEGRHLQGKAPQSAVQAQTLTTLSTQEGVHASTVEQPEDAMEMLKERAMALKVEVPYSLLAHVIYGLQASEFCVVPHNPALQEIKLGERSSPPSCFPF